MQNRKLRINAHSHLLPYPEDIPDFMREHEIFWIDPDRKFMLQKDWKRPITDASFFLDEKLAWMEKHHIDHSVVLNLSQLYGNTLPPEYMKPAIRFQNDFNARIQQKYPHKFTTGFVVNPFSNVGACKEIRRCVEELDMHLLCLPTHYLSADGKWKSIFNAETNPIFELANEYELAIEVHPYDGEKFIKLENISWRFHLIWMLAQCADAYHFYTLDDYPQRYPGIRTCFAHGGQLSQIGLGRRIQGFDGRPDLFEGQRHPRRSVGHKNIFFDTLVHDTGSLQLLIKNQTTSQIVVGLDDPYPLGEMENIKQSSYPGKLLDLAIEQNIITPEAKDAMWEDNVLQWLFGDNAQKKQDLRNRILHS